MELSGRRADGEAIYAGRSMDVRNSLVKVWVLYVEKKNINDVIQKIEAQVNYSFNDHVMDDFSLRTQEMKHDHITGEMYFDQSSMQVTRRTLNSRIAVTSKWDKFNLIIGLDLQQNRRAGNMIGYNMNMPMTTDMKFNSYGTFGELNYQLSDQNKWVGWAH